MSYEYDTDLNALRSERAPQFVSLGIPKDEVEMTDQFNLSDTVGDVPHDQLAGSTDRLHRRTSPSRWGRRVLAAAVAAAGLAAMTVGAGAAHADTLPNSDLVQLGQYSIPSEPPAAVTPQLGGVYGDTLPTSPGALGNPTEVFMHGTGSSTTQALGIQGDSSAWGAQVETENATGSAGQIWRFQLVGWIAALTQTSQQITSFGNPSGLLQEMPVYKIINYHSDGTHTCLDGYGGNPTAGTMIDSYGCDPNQVNQTNQLWVVADTTADAPMINASGQQYEFTPGNPATAPYFPEWLTSELQASPWHSSEAVYGDYSTVIESVGAIEASGGSTTQAPFLSAGYANIDGVNSPVWLWNQFPVDQANSAWLLSDITPPASSGSGSGPTGPSCSMFQCLLNTSG
jgi:hypothetical protein